MKKLLTFIVSSLTSLTLLAGQPSEIEEIARLREVADSLHAIGQNDSASIMCARAIDLAHKSGNLTQIVGTHSSQGVMLRSLGKIDEALENYEVALKIVTSEDFRRNPDQEAIEETAALYINLATLELDMQHKENAIKSAKLAGDWISQSSSPDFKSMAYGAAGSVLTGSGDLNTALHFQNLAYHNAMEASNVDAAFRSAAYTMLIADRLGNKADAQSWREKCQKLLPDIQSVMSRLVYYQAECSISMKSGNNKEALKYFNSILGLDGIENLPFIVFDCYNNMHIAYAALGDYRQAYNTVLKGNELRDSLWAQEKAENLRELTVKYETKETELALAQSEARRASTLMWLFGAVALLLIIVIVFVIYASRQRRLRMAREMEFAKLKADIGRQYIEGLETERERMARELHDGVCNDLLAIKMNMSNGASADTTTRLLDSCRESVRRISHELMPPEFAYANIDEVIRYYIRNQQAAYSGKVAIVYSASGDNWTRIPDDVALEVYRIVQEAVGNSLKHSGASEILVSLALHDSYLTLSVKDNGTYAPASRHGIGFTSMKRRAAAIKGIFSAETTDGDSLCLLLTVKISK